MVRQRDLLNKAASAHGNLDIQQTQAQLMGLQNQQLLSIENQLATMGRAQAVQTFENLKHALAAAGATFRDVVKTNLYVVGLKPEHVPLPREVRSRYVDADRPPASTLVGVSALVGADIPG